MNRHIRKWGCYASSFVLLLNLASGTAAAADCTSQAEDIRKRILDLQKKVDDMSGKFQSDHASATSKDYSSKYFTTFEDLNKKATQASELVNSTYDLNGFTKVLAEGQKQTKLPPKVTNTMGNAVELAQAAMNEDNTKLDLAQLRCDQSTEDTALSAYLAQADSNTNSTYKTAKKNTCKAVHILADLQDKREKLNDIRKNGYPLFFLHKKDKKSYDGKSRTIQFKVDLRLYPEYPDNAGNNDNPTGQPILLGKVEKINLSYNSYFKWSDNNWTTLNLYQKLTDEHQQSEFCWAKLNITSSVKAQLCSRVENIKTDSLTVKSRAKFHYSGEDSAVSLGSVTVPAPFGYLADVSDMKEKKMQDLTSNLVDRIASLFGDFSVVKDKTDAWKKSCA